AQPKFIAFFCRYILHVSEFARYFSKLARQQHSVLLKTISNKLSANERRNSRSRNLVLLILLLNAEQQKARHISNELFLIEA
ncbi:hypothetical protein, partial [Cognaticolwellia mytili]|uniref:hypothetical protein n=1 Tax=Cognaticolwellia mytili TaxID=1888913 RepID=UPI001B80B932